MQRGQLGDSKTLSVVITYDISSQNITIAQPLQGSINDTTYLTKAADAVGVQRKTVETEFLSKVATSARESWAYSVLQRRLGYRLRENAPHIDIYERGYY